MGSKDYLSFTWWIPLPDTIDLPNKHQRYVTSIVHPTQAIRDGEKIPDDYEGPKDDIDHQLKLTIHQHSFEDSLVDPALELLFDASFEDHEKTPPDVELGARPTQTRYLSIVEAEVQVFGRDGVEEKEISDFFDYALWRIRQLQEATVLFTGQLTKDWVAKERLPFALPMRTTSSKAAPDEDGRSMFLLGFNDLNDVNPPEPLSTEEIDELTGYLHKDDEGASFSAYHRLRYETLVMFHRRGDYRMTIISAAIAAESLFDEMLQTLLWDEGRYPEQVAEIFNPDTSSVLKRVKTEFRRHLGGNWSVKQKGAIKDWRDKIAEPRNFIAHTGASATSEHAREAVDALQALEKFFSKRLLEKVESRPRTAMMFVGSKRITAEGKITKKLQQLYDDPSQPLWAPTLRRWRTIVGMEIDKIRGLHIKPDLSESVLLAVDNDGKSDFYLVDEQVLMAARVKEVNDEIHAQYERGLKSLEGQEKPDELVMRLILNDAKMKKSLPVEGDWRYAYRLIPTLGVMSNKQDRA